MKLSRQISLFFILFLFCSPAFAEISSDAKQSVYVSAEPLGATSETIASEPEIISNSPEVKEIVQKSEEQKKTSAKTEITEPELNVVEGDMPYVKAEPLKKADESVKPSVASSTEEPVKKFSKTMTEKELKKQDVLTKQKVMDFVVENQDRQAGEGWLFNARYYFELKQHERALKEIDTLVRSEEINPRMIWEAKLLRDEIYKDLKKYDEALKNLDKLINKDKPGRIYLVRAKIARAELLSRDLTGYKELLDAFKRYYWHFPEKKDVESIEYLIGFQKGYDLEIAMQAMEAWEEIAKFPEIEAANLANLHLAMLFAFDLNKPERSFEYLNKIRDDMSLSAEVKLIRAVIGHFYTKNPDLKAIDDFYDDYCHSVNDLYGFRVGSILYGQFLSEKKKDYEAAVNAFDNILHTPSRLIASESISIDKQREENDEQIDWSMLASRMAAYVCEFKLKNLDRARLHYLRIKELGETRSKEIKDPVNDAALKRTEPSKSMGEAMFAMAYEKYRQQNYKDAIRLYDEFSKKYPESPLYKEALFRIAVIMDDDLRRYDEARAMYEHYIIQFKPLESRWKLDKLYDWGRVDEARYRIGNLLSIHLNQPVEALEIFKNLADAYPDSYWAKQGLIDSIKIYQDEVADPNKATELMKDFIKRYPESEEAAEYRLVLYNVALGMGDEIEALHIIREYLDHRLPSDKKYFTYKQQWRELVFRIREENLRNRLTAVGELDKIGVYQSLIDVVALASTTAPLEKLITEIKGLDIKDEYRWALAYEAGTRLYTDYPDKAYDLFSDLAQNATGTPQIACLLTLGNIAYRVKKDAKEAIKWYEKVEPLLPLTSPANEVPQYRLGRLYLFTGHGLKGMEKLRKFITHYPDSKYVPKSYMVLGDACVALHSPEKASRYYSRVLRLSPALADEARKKIESLEGSITSEQWLKKKSGKVQDEVDEKALAKEEEEFAKFDKSMADAADKVKNFEELEEKDLRKIDSETLYGLFLKENKSKKPDPDRLIMFLTQILTRSNIPTAIRERALRQFISTGFFRFKDFERFTEASKSILIKHNYADWLSELLFKLAQCQDYQANDYVEANKSYFEYVSFYPTGRHVLDVRSRIPEVYELAEDEKNAIRFYLKLTDDTNLPDEYRIKASMSLAKLYLSDDKKSEAIKTYEVALGFETDRKPEICLRLEKLTDDFSYIQRALDYTGSETYRLKALKRLIKKSEDDEKYEEAKKLLTKYASSFSESDSILFIEKKADELGKRGAIADMEDLIDKYPEEEETPGRMFKLAKMVEGTENTKYRAEDLFYEITLVYPESEFFKESKIRADNVRAVKASAQLSDMLKKGNKPSESEEIILERARLLKENLKDLQGAMENYESFVKLFPNSKHLDEVYIILGDLALSENHDSEKAFKYWELGMQASVDVFNRETLTERINSLRLFNTRVVDSDKKSDHEKGLNDVFIVWKMENNPLHALGLLKNAYSKAANKPQASLLHYYAGRIYEDNKKYDSAKEEYEKALSYRSHSGCRHDMVLYRLARMSAADSKKEEAANYYKRLVNKYPRSLLSRSGYYWLYKYYDEKKELRKSYENLEKLLTTFKALNPIHRDELEKKLKDVGSRMNIADMEYLKKYSKLGGGELPYYIGKVMENDLRDSEKAIAQYEDYLKTNPPIARGREVMDKIAQLYEKNGDYVKAVGYLDMLLSTYEPKASNYDLILRIGTLLEHKVKNDTLTELFFSSIEGEYYRVRKVRDYARAKLRRLEEKKIQMAVKPTKKKVVKREYTDDDEEVLEELKEIISKYVDDLADYKMAERQMEDLWEDNVESLATLDIMKALVDLNMKKLLDPDKAAKYYAKWLEENPNDPLYKDYTIKLYDHYMEVLRDGNKALRLLEDYTKVHPISLESLDIELKLAKANETRLRNYDEALRGYQRIIDTRQNDVTVHEAYFRMGFVYRDGFANYNEAIKSWQTLIDDYYNNDFSDQAQFAIAYTYEAYLRDYTKARAAYNLILNRYPNSSLQNDVRNAILRIEGK